jgi:hypothetical protein
MGGSWGSGLMLLSEIESRLAWVQTWPLLKTVTISQSFTSRCRGVTIPHVPVPNFPRPAQRHTQCFRAKKKAFNHNAFSVHKSLNVTRLQKKNFC